MQLKNLLIKITTRKKEQMVTIQCQCHIIKTKVCQYHNIKDPQE